MIFISKNISYKPLWKLLIDKNLSQSELINNSDISKSTFYKLKQNKNVTTDSLKKICEALDCNISDIITCEDKKEK